MTDPSDLSKLRIRRDQADTVPARNPWPLVGLGLVVVAALALWFAWPRGTSVTVAEASVSGGNRIAAAGGILANGYVVARTQASVSARIAGRLEFLGVTEGSKVRKGDVLARLESADFAAALAAARADVARVEAELAQARRDLDRARQLRDEQVIAEAALEDAGTRVSVLEAQLNASRAQARLAEVNFGNTRVRAPFDGTVLRLDAEVGEMVAPASAGGGLTRTAIATMADLATLEVEVDVNEAYIAQVTNGQDARITLDAYPDTSFTGRVRQVVPTADRQKATVMVKVSILDRDPRILPEMGAKVRFVPKGETAAAAAAPRVVRVPAAAVANDGDEASVWVVADERATRRSVSLGRVEGDQVEVREGLDGGEMVIVAPPDGLRDGVRVRTSRS